MIDLASLRADTPSCENLLHFNNAGASLMPAPVYQALLDHQALEQRIGGYAAHDAAADLRTDFYAAFAEMLNCDASEIAFMESATKAWSSVFYALPLRAGDRILIHRSVYASNYLAVLQQVKRLGLIVDYVPSDDQGQIDVAAIPALITSRTKLILLTHCPSQSGLIQPAKAVGKVAKDYGVLYLLDACQSAGQMLLDVTDIGCDAMTGTGRKFLRGPRGTGFLYMRSELANALEPVMIDLTSAVWDSPQSYSLVEGAKRFEAFERHLAGQIALGRATRYALSLGLDQIETRIQSLANRLRAQLSEEAGVVVHDPGIQRSGIVTFSKQSVDVDYAKHCLRDQHINISTVPRDWARLDAKDRNLPDLMRASLHVYNSEVEIAQFVKAVDAL